MNNWNSFVSIIIVYNLYSLAETSRTSNKLNALNVLLSVLEDEEVTQDFEAPPPFDRMTEMEGLRNRHTLSGLYEELDRHPALLQRRFYIGSQKPTLHEPVIHKRTMHTSSGQPAMSVCPSQTEWRLIYTARDINDTLVDIYQPEDAQQWFYTVTCMNDHRPLNRECPGCCIGIDHSSYRSQCIQKYSLVNTIGTYDRGLTFQWTPIVIPSSCNCAITKISYPIWT